MRGERGQASVEWVGALLATALALGALARLADRVEATTLGVALLRSTTCAVRGDCERNRLEGDRAEGDRAGSDRLRRSPERVRTRAVTAPPLVPVVPTTGSLRPEARGRRTPAGGGGRGPLLGGTARRRAGVLWRRAWLACFGYERVRYGLLHPETRPRQTVPISGMLQMANDCLSPFDFARDWELLRPR